MAGPNGSANGSANGGGEVAKRDPAPSTLFERESKDMGDIKGLGHVVLHEAALMDLWPYLGSGEDAQTFGLRLLAASLEVDGARISFEDMQRAGMRKMRVLQRLLAEVHKLNALDAVDDEVEDEGTEKNVDAAGPESEQDGSPRGTDS